MVLKGKKKLTKDKPIEALQTLQSLKRGTRKKEKRKMLGRGFHKEWKEEYTWLEYNEEED